MSTTSSKNFTTLYSGAGSVVPQGAYGNANVVSLLAAGTDGGNTVTNIIATGNVTAANFIGNLIGNISGNVLAPGSNTQVIYNNSGVFGTDSDFTFNSATNTLSVPVVTASGNVTGAYILGNGSQLTGLPATYSNAQVSAFLASGTNSANIITSANIAGSYFLGNGSQLTGLPEIYGNANVSAYLASGTNTANIVTQANVVGAFLTTSGANGNIQGANYISGNAFIGNTVSVVGNVTASYFLGNGSQLTGLPATYGNANVVSLLAAFGSNTISTTGNVSTGNVIVPNGSRYRGDFTAGGTAGRSFFQTTDTNTTAATFLSAIPGPNHVATGGTIGSATGLFSTNDAGNASIFGMYSYPNDSAIRSLSTGTGNINDVTFKFGLAGTLAATITQGGNVVAVANLTSTQQTVVGTANATGGTGNIVVSGKNIATDMAFNPDGGNATNAALSRINIGTGWNGNITHSAIQNRLVVQDTYNRTNTGTAVQLFASDPIVNLTANVTTNSFRAQAIGGRVRIGGGSAANTIQLTGGAGVIGSIAALQPNIDVGNVSPYNLGNTTVSHATLNGGFITMYQGSLLGNAYGMIPGALATSTGNALAAGNITNYIGFASQLAAAPYTTGNLYAFYHGNAASSAQQSATGIGTANAARTAANYYAFRNDDPVAQVQLGSLRNYHEYQYSTATSGTVNIDKNNAQIQYIAPTANVTIGDFQNFVTTASNSVSDINQTDTVTLIIKQGATPYSVFMPTGNAAIKYASGNSTVGSTANAVTMISVSAANVAGAALYMVTVSPEFT